jgi:hypothetical protein
MGGAFYLECFRVESRALVVRYAAAILRVADALERHAILQGDQVAALSIPRRKTGQGLLPSVQGPPWLSTRPGVPSIAVPGWPSR